jgi:hypothetical protein
MKKAQPTPTPRFNSFIGPSGIKPEPIMTGLVLSAAAFAAIKVGSLASEYFDRVVPEFTTKVSIVASTAQALNSKDDEDDDED